MEITSGPHRGRTATLRQFANNWITVDIDGERPNTIVQPNQVKLTPEEITTVRTANPEHLGMFWDMWQLYDDGTFIVRETEGQTLTMGATGHYGRGRRYRR